MHKTREEMRAAFKEAYASLNAAQRKAVEATEGPVMVIAGPGTGKTQILTLRIANILLKTDTSPDSILALTFTESGAKAMRERLHRYIGSDAYRVAIHTFHGFAERLISEYPDAYNRVIGGRPATDLEKIESIETILDNPSFSLLRPVGDPSYYVTHILRIISQLKQEYVTPEMFSAIIANQEEELSQTPKYHEKGAHKGKVRGDYTKQEKTIAKNRELLAAYQQYEALLRDKKRYDFDDMVIETVEALSSHASMLRDLQEKYLYVLADEHQDVNGSQNKILELLTNYHESPNIFVVGDEKQAIYRFQGASLENFLYFQDHYTDTQVIQLTENYRSGQPILDAAHSLVAVEDGPLSALRVPLLAALVDVADVSVAGYEHQAIEDEAVVEAVVEAVEGGVLPEEVAIIVRTNREVETFAALLRKRGLTVTASADGDIISHPIAEAVFGLLKAVLTDKDESALFSVLHGAYWNIPLTDLIIIAGARNYDTSLMSLLCDMDKLKLLKLTSPESAHHVYQVIQKAHEKEVTEPPHRVLEYLVEESGLLEYVMKNDPVEGVRVLRRLYDEIEALVLREGMNTLRAVLNVIEIHKAYGLSLTAPYIVTNHSAVQVMTAHKSKGLEFEVVFVPHLYDSLWGGAVKKNYFDIPLPRLLKDEVVDVVDDERRLFYVAMTRARRRLHLSHAAINSDGRALTPTRLFDALDPATYRVLDTKEKHVKYDPGAILKSVCKNKSIEADLLRAHLAGSGFSVTSLNNYLKNPFDYFYRNVLRIPEVQSVTLQFGTAIHNTLEAVMHYRAKQGVLPSDTEIKRFLEQELGRLPLSQNEYVRLHERGMSILYPYLTYVSGRLPATTKEELKLRVLLETGLQELPEIPLTGKLDRIDLDENGYAIRVVDYKTGKPKTRNEIEGKTASSDGNYKRQLVFYALLLELYGDDRYRCKEGVLSFVEPDKKGLIHEESFLIEETEIESLRASIVEAARGIISGDFLTDEVLAAESVYADLALSLVKRIKDDN